MGPRLRETCTDGAGLRPESALVVALARGDLRAVRAACERGPDLEAAGKLAVEHQVEGLCYWSGWRERAASDLPEASERLAPGLERGFMHHSLRNESLVRDLRALNDALRVRGIESLVLKGPWVAFHAYPDPGTRPVADIDLCVREADYRGTVAALATAGYQPVAPLPATGAAALSQAHFGGQLHFVAAGKRPLELHFRLVNIGPPSHDESWVHETAREVAVGDVSLTVPGPEAMLLHLVLHAAQHAFSSLRLLHDIRFALERDPGTAGSPLFLETIRDLGCASTAYHALVLAAEIAGARVDEEALDALRPSPLASALYRRVWRLDAVRRLEGPVRDPATEAPLLYLLGIGRFPDKVRYLRGLAVRAGGLVPLSARGSAALHPGRASRRGTTP